MSEIDWDVLLSGTKRKPEEAREVKKEEALVEKTSVTLTPTPPSPPAPPKTPILEVEPVTPVIETKREEVKTPEEILTEESATPVKEVWLIFGDKGTGKTTVAMSFPGETLVLSFDRKSAIIKYNMYNNDKRIHVFDVVKYMDYSSPEKMTESATKVFEYINYLLDNYTKKYSQPDWVVIDGAQIFQQICEWTMRHRHNLGPFDGIANLNLWKERRMYIRQIHNKALNLAKRGVIYTTYVEKDEVVIKGEVVTRKDTPAWIDVLIYETDYVIYTYHDETKKTYHVRVVSSKNDKKIKSGTDIDVTNKKFSEFVNWSM